MGVIQHFQVRCAADGSQHGLRAGPEADQSQYSESWAHLHEVRPQLNSRNPSSPVTDQPGACVYPNLSLYPDDGQARASSRKRDGARAHLGCPPTYLVTPGFFFLQSPLSWLEWEREQRVHIGRSGPVCLMWSS